MSQTVQSPLFKLNTIMQSLYHKAIIFYPLDYTNTTMSDLIDLDYLNIDGWRHFSYEDISFARSILLDSLYSTVAFNHDVELMKFVDLCFPNRWSVMQNKLYKPLSEKQLEYKETDPKHFFWAMCFRSEDHIMCQDINDDMFDYFYSKLSREDIEHLHPIFCVGRKYENCELDNTFEDVLNAMADERRIDMLIRNYPQFLRTDEVNYCIESILFSLNSKIEDSEDYYLTHPEIRDILTRMINKLIPYCSINVE